MSDVSHMTVTTRGLPGDWLNGWLAAVGTTVLLPDLKLRWTSDPVPIPVFSNVNSVDDLADRLTNALPTADQVGQMSIARPPSNADPFRMNNEFPRDPSPAAWSERAKHERNVRDGTLSATVTDLILAKGKIEYRHAPFDAAVPKGITLWQRYAACIDAWRADPGRVRRTLNGRGERLKMNGLGFDYRRLNSPLNPNAGKYADPVVEVLAFHACTLFPVFGDGRQRQTRGWLRRRGLAGEHRRRETFAWTTWAEPLDRFAIDAYLDSLFSSDNPDRWRTSTAGRAIGADRLYLTQSYKPQGTSDTTRAFATIRLK